MTLQMGYCKVWVPELTLLSCLTNHTCMEDRGKKADKKEKEGE